MKYSAQEITKWSVTKETTTGWLPARSENHKFESLLSKVKTPRAFLTGKYDVVDWEEG